MRGTGDYVVFHGKTIKVGKDGMMSHLRWNQKDLVEPVQGDLTLGEQIEHLWFRAPRTVEASVVPGEFTYEGWCGVRPIRFVCKRDRDGNMSRFERDMIDVLRSAPGVVKIHNDNIGVDVAIPCCHGYISDDLPENVRYNGLVTSALGVAAVGVRNGRAAALLGCLSCGAVIPCWCTLEELEENTEAFAGEEADWAAMMTQLREIQACVGGNRVVQAQQPQMARYDDSEED